MRNGFGVLHTHRLWQISLIITLTAALAIGISCSRTDSGRDESPSGPSAPYRLSITVKPSELYPFESSLVMIDVKDGYGERLDEAVVVNLTTTGGYFENGDNRISGEVLSSGSLWLKYDPDHEPKPDTPGTKTITGIIDYGCESSYVTDTAEVFFLSQGDQVGTVSLRADPSTITDADNGYSIITATVMGQYGAAMANVSVYFSVQGGQNSTFDATVVDTDARGVAQTVFRPNGDIGLLRVCGQAGTKTSCTEVRSDKAVQE